MQAYSTFHNIITNFFIAIIPESISSETSSITRSNEDENDTKAFTHVQTMGKILGWNLVTDQYTLLQQTDIASRRPSTASVHFFLYRESTYIGE